MMKFFVLMLPVISLLSLSVRPGVPDAVNKLVISDCEDAALWEGGSLDSEHVKEGKASIKWAHGESASVTITQFPHDWSEYNHLSFWLYSERATKSRFMLILRSENDKLDGADYYSMRIVLNFAGWRKFALFFSEMGVNRSPLGWQDIQAVNFTASGWGHTPNPDAVVYLDDIVISKEAPMKGPRITDAEFFDAVNLDYPGMEKVRAAVQKGELKAAKHEFVEHIKRREKPVWYFDWRSRPSAIVGSDKPNTAEADKIMAHELPSVGVTHKFEGEIDWTLNPINYREWPWQLNRHPFWNTLGKAYWDTGDEKYAQEFVYQMTHWVENCPVPTMDSGNGSATWRTIEAGIRTSGSWMTAFNQFLSSPSFTDEAVITMIKSFVEHARHLMTWPTGGNWLTMESNGLFHIGTMFPEFKEAGDWRKTAIDRMYAELDNQVYPDGAQIELTTGYHQVSLSNFVRMMEIGKLNNVEFPADYLDKLERMYDYDLYASMPNGHLPGLNDGGEVAIRRYMQQGFGYFPDRQDFQWAATGGAKGEMPIRNSYAFTYAGQYVMRSGWDIDDRYLLLDAGPFGYGHQHEDKLSFVLYAFGKVHVTDPGNYAYDSSKWRRYVISTYAHNTIMVDGMPQNRRRLPRSTFVTKEPLDNRWISRFECDYCVGVYDEGYGKEGDRTVSHKRRVFFVKPDYWIVTDTMTPSDDSEHKYESMFHLDAVSATVDSETGKVETENPDVSNFAIIPPMGDDVTVEIISGQEEPIVQGWKPAGGYRVRPIPTPIFTKTGRGATWFVYVFFPIPRGQDLLVTSVEPVEVKADGKPYPDARAVKISFEDGITHYFIQADKGGDVMDFADFSTDAEAALIMLGPDGGVESTIEIR